MICFYWTESVGRHCGALRGQTASPFLLLDCLFPVLPYLTQIQDNISFTVLGFRISDLELFATFKSELCSTPPFCYSKYQVI